MSYIKESDTKRIAKTIFRKTFKKPRRIIFKNEEGTPRSKQGWPDWMVCVEYGEPVRLLSSKYATIAASSFRFYFEIKAHWKDDKADNFEKQKHHIKTLRNFGFITAFLVGREIKFSWDDPKPESLEELLKNLRDN